MLLHVNSTQFNRICTWYKFVILNLKLLYNYSAFHVLSLFRNKQHREAAILLQQAITSQRAMKHAAWGAKKEISAKLRALKESEFNADKSGKSYTELFELAHNIFSSRCTIIFLQMYWL